MNRPVGPKSSRHTKETWGLKFFSRQTWLFHVVSFFFHHGRCFLYLSYLNLNRLICESVWFQFFLRFVLFRHMFHCAQDGKTPSTCSSRREVEVLQPGRPWMPRKKHGINCAHGSWTRNRRNWAAAIGWFGCWLLLVVGSFCWNWLPFFSIKIRCLSQGNPWYTAIQKGIQQVHDSTHTLCDVLVMQTLFFWSQICQSTLVSSRGSLNTRKLASGEKPEKPIIQSNQLVKSIAKHKRGVNQA